MAYAGMHEKTEREAALETRLVALMDDIARLRDRVGSERERARREGRDAVLDDLLETADGLERALAIGDHGPWVEGVRAVLEGLHRAMARHGLRPAGEPGEPFDPAIHEALAAVPGPSGRVVGLVRRGWMRPDGSLLRAAHVTVGA